MNIQKLAILIGKIIPDIIGLGIYRFVFYIIKIVFELKGFKMTLRNSVATGTMSFGTSDIDLNLWISSTFHLDKFCSLEKKIKRVIPIMGEFNIIDPKNVESMLRFINPYLLQKDPQMVKSFPNLKLDGDDCDKVSYLIRSYISNIGKFEQYPEQSKKKWKYYLSQIGVTGLKEINRTVIKDIIHKMIPDLDLEYLENIPKGSDQEINDFYQSGKFRVEEMCLTPTIWLGSAVLYDRVMEDIEMISNPKHLEVMISGLKWEIWGIYTQHHFIEREGLLIHLDKIKNVFEIIEQGEHNGKVAHLITGINELLEIVANER